MPSCRNRRRRMPLTCATICTRRPLWYGCDNPSQRRGLRGAVDQCCIDNGPATLTAWGQSQLSHCPVAGSAMKQVVHRP